MLVPHGLEPELHQRILSAGGRHRGDGPDTGQPSIAPRSLLVFTMTPHTTPLLVLTHRDAADPILSAAQHSALPACRP